MPEAVTPAEAVQFLIDAGADPEEAVIRFAEQVAGRELEGTSPTESPRPLLGGRGVEHSIEDLTTKAGMGPSSYRREIMVRWGRGR